MYALTGRYSTACRLPAATNRACCYGLVVASSSHAHNFKSMILPLKSRCSYVPYAYMKYIRDYDAGIGVLYLQTSCLVVKLVFCTQLINFHRTMFFSPQQFKLRHNYRLGEARRVPRHCLDDRSVGVGVSKKFLSKKGGGWVFFHCKPCVAAFLNFGSPKIELASPTPPLGIALVR